MKPDDDAENEPSLDADGRCVLNCDWVESSGPEVVVDGQKECRTCGAGQVDAAEESLAAVRPRQAVHEPGRAALG